MQLTICDYCKSSEAPASEIIVTVARRVAASETGKKGHREQVAYPVAVELCGLCAARYGLAIEMVADAVRDGSYGLPPLSEDGDGGMVDLTAPADDLPSLPLPAESDPSSKRKQKRETAAG